MPGECAEDFIKITVMLQYKYIELLAIATSSITIATSSITIASYNGVTGSKCRSPVRKIHDEAQAVRKVTSLT